MKPLVLVYRKCSTCQKALKWLEENHIAYEERPIKEENPTEEELKDCIAKAYDEKFEEWYKRSGLPLKRFFNTSGNLYKELKLKDRLADMTEEEQLRLLATDGMLVKRPLLVTQDYICPGFKEEQWKEHI